MNTNLHGNDVPLSSVTTTDSDVKTMRMCHEVRSGVD